MLYSYIIHIQLYTYTCGNIVNTIMTNEHTSLEKYTSHTLFEMVMKGLCVRGELETEQTILTPQFLCLYQHFFLLLLGCSGVLRAHSPLLGAGSHYSILSPTNWLQTKLNFLSHWVISLFDAHLLPVNVAFTPNSIHPQSWLYPDIFNRMHLLFTQVHFLFDSSAEGQYVTLRLANNSNNVNVFNKAKMEYTLNWFIPNIAMSNVPEIET